MIYSKTENMIPTIAVQDLQSMVLNYISNYDEKLKPILDSMDTGSDPELFKQGFIQGMVWTSLLANVNLYKCFIEGDIINK